jgi:putative endonuclease
MTNDNDSVLYTGMINDLPRRVFEHGGGEIPGFTAEYQCRELICYEHCTNALDAITREKQIKNWARAKKGTLVVTFNPRPVDLAHDLLGNS